MFSTFVFIRPLPNLRTRSFDNKLIDFDAIFSISGARESAWNCQRSRLYNAEDRFAGLAKASFLIPLELIGVNDIEILARAKLLILLSRYLSTRNILQLLDSTIIRFNNYSLAAADTSLRLRQILCCHDIPLHIAASAVLRVGERERKGRNGRLLLPISETLRAVRHCSLTMLLPHDTLRPLIMSYAICT